MNRERRSVAYGVLHPPVSCYLQATIREDYRCIATRTLDKAYGRTLRVTGPIHGPVEPLEYCHIFAKPSTGTVVDGCQDKVHIGLILQTAGLTR